MAPPCGKCQARGKVQQALHCCAHLSGAPTGDADTDTDTILVGCSHPDVLYSCTAECRFTGRDKGVSGTTGQCGGQLATEKSSGSLLFRSSMRMTAFATIFSTEITCVLMRDSLDPTLNHSCRHFRITISSSSCFLVLFMFQCSCEVWGPGTDSTTPVDSGLRVRVSHPQERWTDGSW